MKTFAQLTVEQGVVNDPVTGHAFMVYYLPGDHPQMAVAEVDKSGLVLAETILKDGNGGSSLDFYRIGVLDDSHNYLTIAMDKNGYIHVAGNQRSHRPMGYWRSATPRSVGSMTYKSQLEGLTYRNDEYNVYLFATSAERVSVYPRFFVAANGELYFSFNHYDSGQGNYYLLHYDADTKRWNNPSGGSDTTYGFVDQNTPLLDGYNDSMSPYVHTIVEGPDGWYWLMWMWRDEAGNADTNSRLSVMKTRDFTTWVSPTGRPLPSSIKYSYVDTGTNIPGDLEVWSTPKAGSGMLNGQATLGFRDDGTPVISTFALEGKKTSLYVFQLGYLGNWLGGTPVPSTGLYDLKNDLGSGRLAIDGPPVAVPGADDFLVNFTCYNAELDAPVGLQARVGPGPMGTPTKLVSYDYQRELFGPRVLLTRYDDSVGPVTARSSLSVPYVDENGVRLVWAIKWDAGAYFIAGDGLRPADGYPVGGTPITLVAFEPLR